VETGRVHLGEGAYEQGTILFSSSAEDKIEILWKDRQGQRRPKTVKLRGDATGVRNKG
jgi:hypothetical protein